jgi:pre-mRNA-splicing factor ATP-dependent RNA helicase DHX15/PRP43
MSATGDVTSFMNYFHDFKPREIQLVGKPQKLHKIYLSPEEREISYEVMALAALGRIYDTGIQGDVLIFLPGEASIRQVFEKMVDLNESEEFRDRVGLVEVLMLFRDLPIDEQGLITTDKFDSEGNRYRKVILATNMAETSITIEDLVVVVDAGQNKMSIFDHAFRGSELLPVPNSQAQSDQRAGRAGRRQDGICIFCYTRDECKQMPIEASRPLTRVDLTLFILKVLALPLFHGDLSKFKWFSESSSHKSNNDGSDPTAKPTPQQLSYALGRLGAYGYLASDSPVLLLTEQGRTAADLDVEPELANLLELVKPQQGVLPAGVHEVLVLLALRSGLLFVTGKMIADNQSDRSPR